MGTPSDHVDVVIVGAGLSGVGAACRLQAELPGTSYTILEARAAVGGTWDLFRYPGVRSDSDMFTLGYPFRPWTGGKAIADGPSILKYVQDTAAEHGIENRIRFRTRLAGAAWSSAEGLWFLELEVTDDDGSRGRRRLTCSFLYLCTGYYDYERCHEPVFPGLDSFRGTVVRPQFWPSDLDYAGKRIVVIGSGATAVTLVPSLADQAGHVTMLQRSPTYITAVPSRDRFSDAARKYLPARTAHRLARTKNILLMQGFYQFCRRWPDAARKLISRQMASLLGDAEMVREHFVPKYNPWDQRLCVAPGGDFHHALKSKRASVVTGAIDTFTPGGIRLASGAELEADVVVVATGLSMLPLGGTEFTVDGSAVSLGDSWVYRGVMLSGVPNLALCVGYTNASWTLRADLSSRYVCRLLRYMDRHGHRSAVPAAGAGMAPRPLLALTSGYVQRAAGTFPRQGDRQPWVLRQNYLLDGPLALYASLARDMVFDGPATSAASSAGPRQAVRP